MGSLTIAPLSLRSAGDRMLVGRTRAPDPLFFRATTPQGEALREVFREALDRTLLVACTTADDTGEVLAARTVVPEGHRDLPPPDAGALDPALWAQPTDGRPVYEDQVAWVTDHPRQGVSVVRFDRGHGRYGLPTAHPHYVAMRAAAFESANSGALVRYQTSARAPLYIVALTLAW